MFELATSAVQSAAAALLVKRQCTWCMKTLLFFVAGVIFGYFVARLEIVSFLAFALTSLPDVQHKVRTLRLAVLNHVMHNAALRCRIVLYSCHSLLLCYIWAASERCPGGMAW